MAGVQIGARQHQIVGLGAPRVGVLAAAVVVLVRRLLAVRNHRAQRRNRALAPAVDVEIAADRQISGRQPFLRLDQTHQFRGFLLPDGRGGGQQVHAHGEQILVPRQIDFRPGEIAVADFRIVPLVGSGDGEAAHDAVGNLRAALHIVIEVGAEMLIDPGAVGRIGDVEFLDQRHIRAQRFENALARRFIALGASAGDVGRHHGKRVVVPDLEDRLGRGARRRGRHRHQRHEDGFGPLRQIVVHDVDGQRTRRPRNNQRRRAVEIRPPLRRAVCRPGEPDLHGGLRRIGQIHGDRHGRHALLPDDPGLAESNRHLGGHRVHDHHHVGGGALEIGVVGRREREDVRAELVRGRGEREGATEGVEGPRRGSHGAGAEKRHAGAVRIRRRHRVIQRGVFQHELQGQRIDPRGGAGNRHAHRLGRDAENVAGREGEGVGLPGVGGGRRVDQRPDVGQEAVAGRRGRTAQLHNRRRRAVGRDGKGDGHAGRRELGPQRDERRRNGGRHRHLDDLGRHAQAVAGREGEGLHARIVRGRPIEKIARGRRETIVARPGAAALQRQHGRRRAQRRDREHHRHSRRRAVRPHSGGEPRRRRLGTRRRRRNDIRPDAVHSAHADVIGRFHVQPRRAIGQCRHHFVRHQRAARGFLRPRGDQILQPQTRGRRRAVAMPFEPHACPAQRGGRQRALQSRHIGRAGGARVGGEDRPVRTAVQRIGNAQHVCARAAIGRHGISGREGGIAHGRKGFAHHAGRGRGHQLVVGARIARPVHIAPARSQSAVGGRSQGRIAAARVRREIDVRRHLHLVIQRVGDFRPIDRERVGSNVRHAHGRNGRRRGGHRNADGLQRRARAVARRERERPRADIVRGRRVAQLSCFRREDIARRCRRAFERQNRRGMPRRRHRKRHRDADRGGQRSRVGSEDRRRRGLACNRHVDRLGRHAGAVARREGEGLRADIVRRRRIAQLSRPRREDIARRRRRAFQRQDRSRIPERRHREDRRHQRRRARRSSARERRRRRFGAGRRCGNNGRPGAVGLAGADVIGRLHVQPRRGVGQRRQRLIRRQRAARRLDPRNDERLQAQAQGGRRHVAMPFDPHACPAQRGGRQRVFLSRHIGRTGGLGIGAEDHPVAPAVQRVGDQQFVRRRPAEGRHGIAGGDGGISQRGELGTDHARSRGRHQLVIGARIARPVHVGPAVGHAGVPDRSDRRGAAATARREVGVRRHLHLVGRRIRAGGPVDRERIGSDVRHARDRDVNRRGGHRDADGLQRRARAVARRERERPDAHVVGRRRVAQHARARRETVARRRRLRLQRKRRRRNARRRNRERRRHGRRRAHRAGVGAERGRGGGRIGHGHVDGLRRHADAVAGREGEGPRAEVAGRRRVAQHARARRETVARRRRLRLQGERRRRTARRRNRERHGHIRGRPERPRIRAKRGNRPAARRVARPFDVVDGDPRGTGGVGDHQGESPLDVHDRRREHENFVGRGRHLRHIVRVGAGRSDHQHLVAHRRSAERLPVLERQGAHAARERSRTKVGIGHVANRRRLAVDRDVPAARRRRPGRPVLSREGVGHVGRPRIRVVGERLQASARRRCRQAQPSDRRRSRCRFAPIHGFSAVAAEAASVPGLRITSA